MICSWILQIYISALLLRRFNLALHYPSGFDFTKLIHCMDNFFAPALCWFSPHFHYAYFKCTCLVLFWFTTALELYRLDLRFDWNYCRSNNAFATFNCVLFHSIVSPRYGVQNKADIHSVSLAVSLDQLQISVWRQWAKCSHLHGNVNTKTLTFASRLYLTSHGISLDELQILDNELDVVMNTVTRTPVFPMPLLHDYNEWSYLNLSYKILKKKKPVILVFALRVVTKVRQGSQH